MITTLRIGSLSISTYWLMLCVGAIGMLVCLWCRRYRFNLLKQQCIIFTLLLTVVGVIGAKLLFILENFQETLTNGVSMGGVSFFGSVFLIPLLMPLVGKMFRLSGSQTMDICGPCVAIMIGCMRVGCFFSGCCGGWEMCVGEICFRWPTQAVESIGDFAILGVLLNREKSNVQTGSLYPMFMASYSIMRFVIEFFRETVKDWLYLSHGQWFALAALTVGLIWLAGLKRRGRT